MAQQALGAGTVAPRKRALFGLLDADGWGWASVKAFAVAHLHHLHPRLPARPGLLPDGRQHGRSRRPGLVADQPLPAVERVAALPGAGRRGRPVRELAAPSWRSRRRGPTARSSRSGPRSCTSAGPTGRPRSPPSTWRRPSGPATSTSGPRARRFPTPRADASVAYVAGSIYVIGGIDASGAPTDKVFVLSPDSQTGALGQWSTADTLKLPEARRLGDRDHRRTGCC